MSTSLPDSAVRDPPPPASPSATSCELALLPLELLLSLQRAQFLVVENNIEIRKGPGAGYNVISNGQVKVDGQQCNLLNCIPRKITLASLKEYRSLQETILSKPMVLFTSVKLTEGCKKDMIYAVIVNTRHPRMRKEIEDSMNKVTAPGTGTTYVLQFTLQKTVQSFFSLKEGYKIHGLGLDFTCELKYDSFDVSHLSTSKTKELNGKIMDLSCITEDEKCKVKFFLDKLGEPNIQIGSVSEQDLGAVSSLCVGSSGKEVFSSTCTPPDAKRTPVKKMSSTQLPAVNEKSYLLQFTQNLPKYIE
ncbi:mesenteric estrogen-dependent adipogenesis protein-like isoform X1 [Scyliorhinus canicula]|uniref:mesenteric estrogen-dependent adipogenesis protein-like isoform X1 n=1 Tax=Scyliorhinus canicula TaxID=7830 RepID=UPI0018F3DC45|nr:mesenteric estrogen-dependent adipogenesis protein-like isoform X1 [Scyliorhinus canicula]